VSKNFAVAFFRGAKKKIDRAFLIDLLGSVAGKLV
jgi:hypothetical protein